MTMTCTDSKPNQTILINTTINSPSVVDSKPEPAASTASVSVRSTSPSSKSITTDSCNSSSSSCCLSDDYGVVDLRGTCTYICPSLTLESGETLYNLPVCYKTYGELNEAADNCVWVCHALTGHAVLEDWWGGLLGQGKAFDPELYYIVCANLLGSCYGTAGPTELNPVTGKKYGKDFPVVTVRDSVKLHNQLRLHLGIRRVCCVVGGSLGGMQALEWCFEAAECVDSCVALACGARQTAWQIGLNAVQRQVIEQDPHYNHGDYDITVPPQTGLSIARQLAMISYRSRQVYCRKFGRKQIQQSDKTKQDTMRKLSHVDENEAIQQTFSEKENSIQHKQVNSINGKLLNGTHKRVNVNGNVNANVNVNANANGNVCTSSTFEVERYLLYQGQKMVRRFDVNSYIRVTQMLDSHDVGRARGGYRKALQMLKLPILVCGVDSDVLYTLEDCKEIGDEAPKAEFHVIHSDEGHDGFLLEQQQIGDLMIQFMDKHAKPVSERQQPQHNMD